MAIHSISFFQLCSIYEKSVRMHILLVLYLVSRIDSLLFIVGYQYLRTS